VATPEHYSYPGADMTGSPFFSYAMNNYWHTNQRAAQRARSLRNLIDIAVESTPERNLTPGVFS
jgi:hypothetical protein